MFIDRREGAAHANNSIGAPALMASDWATPCRQERPVPLFPTREFVYLDGGGKRAARDRCSAPS